MVAADSRSDLLLELASCDDLPAFRRAVEEDGLPIASPARWYGRWWSGAGGPAMGYAERTPLMVAALYGSAAVAAYILSTNLVDANHSCGADSATALHCAAAGGSATSLSVVSLLVAASADIHKVDAGGKKPVDVLPRQHGSSFRKARASLEAILRDGSLPAGAEEDGKSAVDEPRAAARKEYPVDATLPDIKSGVYGTDEFRMYSFKVRPCSRAYTHDWTECPFVHPGENARRRDPRKFQYSCVPCPDFRKGSCRHGDDCEYAHGVFESWLHPQQYRTRLCKDEVGCARRVCFFAHKPDELRHPSGSCSPVAPASSSPRSSLPPLDLGAAAAAALLLSQQQQLLQQQQQPMSPSSTPSALAAMAWLNQSSRSKSDLELDLLSDDYSALLSPLKPPKHQHQQQQSLLTSALLNSRASAFAKRSQSFIDRGAAARSSMAAVAAANSTANYINQSSRSMHNWNSPDGMLDWAVRGEELSKLRKSASFGFRSNGSQMGGGGGGGGSHVLAPASIAEEPDVSWVQSLVADVKPAAMNPYPQYGGASKLSSWGDQLYLEQEQIFA